MIGVLARKFTGYGHGIVFRNTECIASTDIPITRVNGDEEYADVAETIVGLPLGINVDSIQGAPQILGIPTTYGTGFCTAFHGNTTYVYGGVSEPFGINNEMQAFRLGMRAPASAPSVTTGAGSTEQTAYTCFYDEITDEYGPLSPGYDFTGNTSRTWGNIPTEQPEENVQLSVDVAGSITAGIFTVTTDKATFYGRFRVGCRLEFDTSPGQLFTITAVHYQTNTGLVELDDASYGPGAAVVTRSYGVHRATHVVLWVSVNDTLPRESGRVRIGQATYSESVATLALGQAFLEFFEAMPLGNICAYSNHSLLVSGGMDPTKVYISEPFYPERYVALNFPMKNGEAVTGLYPTREYTYITTANSIHMLQGYTENDFVLSVVDEVIGNACQHSATFVEGKLWFCNPRGVFLLDGAPRQMLHARKTEWSTYVSPYLRDLLVTHDPEQQIVRFRTPLATSINPGTDDVGNVLDYDSYNTGDSIPMYCHPWGRLGEEDEIVGADGSRAANYAQLGMETWTEYWVANYGAMLMGDSIPDWTNDRFDSNCAVKDVYDYSFLGARGRYYYIYKDVSDVVWLAYYNYLRGDELPTANPKITTPFLWLPSHGGDSMAGKTLMDLQLYTVHERSNLIVTVASGDEWCAIPYWFADDSEGGTYVSSTMTRSTYSLPATFLSSSSETAVELGTQFTSWAYCPATVSRVGFPVAPEGRGFVFTIACNHSLFFRFLGFKALLGAGASSRRPAGKHTFLRPV